MNIIDAMLCLALALRIHGTEAEVLATAYRVRPLATAYRVRPLVRREVRPLMSRVIRSKSPRTFIETFLKEWN